MPKVSRIASAFADQRPYIKQVHLRDSPPLRNVQAEFMPGINILIGKNGAGKTNFMKLLSRIVDLHTEKYSGEGCEFVIGGKNELRVTFQKQVPTVKEAKSPFFSSYDLPLLANVDGGLKVKKRSMLGEVISESLSSYFDYYIISVWHNIPTDRLPIIDEGTELVLSKAGGLRIEDATRRRRIIESRLVGAIFNSIGVNYNALLLKQNAESVNLDAIRQFIITTLDFHLNRLNTYLLVYTPIQEVRYSEQFQIYHNSSQDELIIKGLALEYKVQEDWLPFVSLSDGTKRIFYLIGEIVTVAATIWNSDRTEFLPIDYDKIIFIEEPELGIHPDQLQLLLQLIREVSRVHQVIMTTHSPQTLDMLSAQELDRITICEFIPGKGTQMRKLSAAKKNKAKAYLRDKGFLSEFWRFSNLEDPD